MTTSQKIQPFTRRTGGLGAHAVYAEGTDDQGNARRAVLAADVIATSTLAADAKGARWAVARHADSAAAQQAFGLFFREVPEIAAVTFDLTAVDADRLRRGVNVSTVYPLQALLEKAAAGEVRIF